MPHYEVAVAVLMNGEKIYIQRRPEEGLLGGLWELPGGKREGRETLEACVRREVFEETGLCATIIDRLDPVRHAYTHFKVTIHPFLCMGSGEERKKGAPHRWVSLGSLGRFAFPAANRKIFDQIRREQSEEAPRSSRLLIAAETRPHYGSAPRRLPRPSR